jgi:hypothetical protein
MKHPAHKSECPSRVGQVAKTLSKYASNFIAATARFASADNGCNMLFLVLVLQFVAIVWGTL